MYFPASILWLFTCVEGEERHWHNASRHFCEDLNLAWSLSSSWCYQSYHFPLFIHYLNAHLSSPLVNHSGRSQTVTQFTSLQLQFIIELVFMDIGQMSEYINS